MRNVNSVAIVTGGANGIGRAVALRLASANFVVELVDLEKDNAENVKTEIVTAGGQAEAYGINATDEQQVKTVIADVIRLRGCVDAIANIAGGTVYLKRIEELTWEEWKADLDRNLKATFLFCREVAPIMISQRSGRIVNTASNYGLTGSALRTPYSAAKAAIIGFLWVESGGPKTWLVPWSFSPATQRPTSLGRR